MADSVAAELNSMLGHKEDVRAWNPQPTKWLASPPLKHRKCSRRISTGTLSGSAAYLGRGERERERYQQEEQQRRRSLPPGVQPIPGMNDRSEWRSSRRSSRKRSTTWSPSNNLQEGGIFARRPSFGGRCALGFEVHDEERSHPGEEDTVGLYSNQMARRVRESRKRAGAGAGGGANGQGGGCATMSGTTLLAEGMATALAWATSAAAAAEATTGPAPEQRVEGTAGPGEGYEDLVSRSAIPACQSKYLRSKSLLRSPSLESSCTLNSYGSFAETPSIPPSVHMDLSQHQRSVGSADINLNPSTSGGGPTLGAPGGISSLYGATDARTRTSPDSLLREISAYGCELISNRPVEHFHNFQARGKSRLSTAQSRRRSGGAGTTTADNGMGVRGGCRTAAGGRGQGGAREGRLLALTLDTTALLRGGSVTTEGLPGGGHSADAFHVCKMRKEGSSCAVCSAVEKPPKGWS